MRLLVIGANGQLGSELVKQAQKDGLDVVGLTRDLLDVAALDACERLGAYEPEVVINTAAMHVLNDCEDEPEDAWTVNVPLPLLSYIGQRDIAYIGVGTDFVFDGKTGDYDEFAACQPLSAYGRTKRAGELAALSLIDACAICRISYLFGSTGCRAKGGGNFIDFIAYSLGKCCPLELDADTRFSPTYAVDAAAQILAVLDQLKAGRRGVFHCANSGACSHYDLGLAVADELGMEHEFMPRFAEPDPLRPKRSNLLNTRLPRAPHWREGLRRYLQETGECQTPNAV